jgi:hypothetical protein
MRWYECPVCGEEIVFGVCRCGSSDEHRTAHVLRTVLPEILETIREMERAVLAAEKQLAEDAGTRDR